MSRFVLPPGVLGCALGLALAAAVALGMARFSYALLLPPMRADLGWTYFTAGAMNTANAAGYLAGALAAPQMLRRVDARAFMLAGGWTASAFLACHAGTRQDLLLLALRFAMGLASAASFVGGGLLAARLAAQAPGQSGLVLGVYYGGVGVGIVGSALLVPAVDTAKGGWPVAWMALAAASLACCIVTGWLTRSLVAPPAPGSPRAPFRVFAYAFGLAGYLMFGVGYIGYMTFIITLLREQGLGEVAITAFYVLLGLGVLASSWLWAGLLQRHRGGRPLATLNALLALACALPLLGPGSVLGGVAVFVSGALFGSVFLSVVASTTALVRHNAEPAAWASGIAAFTIVFAMGQIIGPSAMGWIADGAGGLQRGFVFSAMALVAGAVLAAFQRPVR